MQQTGRLDWIDTARGIGIVLVVLGHALRGLNGAGLFEGYSWFNDADRIIYAFHMPFFFVLSGYFAPRLKIESFSTAVMSRAKRLLYPLVIWTYVFLGFRALAGAASNSGGEFSDLASLPLPPVAHFWFLWALFLLQIPLVGLILTWRMTPRLWAASFLASVLALLLIPTLPGPAVPWLLQALLNAPYFFLGAVLGSFAISPPLDKAALFWGLVALVGLSGVAVQFPTGLWTGLVLAIAMSAAAITVAGGLSAKWGRHRAIGWLRYAGEISLTIYVSHTIFSAGARIAMMKVGIDWLPLHILIGTLAGLIFPALLHIALKKMKLLPALGLS